MDGHLEEHHLRLTFWPPHLCSHTHTGMHTHTQNKRIYIIYPITCLYHIIGGVLPTEADRLRAI